jgi:hypothetical protein
MELRMKAFSSVAAVALSLALVAPVLSGQSISLGLRGTGSFPTGSFADDGTTTDATLIEGAKNGFGYGVDAGISMGMLGLYAGFDHIKFDCETTTCQTKGEYTLQGVTVGVKLMPPMASMFRPFIKGGVTFNNLKSGYGSSSSNRLETDQQPGYEIGAGGDLGFLGIVSITPQVRYVGQNLKAKVPGVNTTGAQPTQGVNYFTFDLGLSVHTPFGM